VTVADATWVMPQPGWVCPECGFDYDAIDPDATADVIRAFGRRYRAPLSRGLPDEDLVAVLRTRPVTGGWSALEYACHVRDSFAVYDWRLARALAEDRPDLPATRRDDAAVERDYNGQDPNAVADELAAAAEKLASALDALPADAWAREFTREGLTLNVDWLARNAVHEGNHHLLDVGRVLRAVRGR
jgi:hypothetical protein